MRTMSRIDFKAAARYVETEDRVELIATSIITTTDDLVVVSQMKTSAANKLAGEWHFPGTGITEPLSEAAVALAAYLHLALGFPVVIDKMVHTWVRNVLEGERTRSVFHVCYRAHYAGSAEDALSKARPAWDLEEIRIVSKREALELLQQGETAWERCHPELLRCI